MDRRIKYTRMVLNESLIKFLGEKDISKITVTEICGDADVNRSTYYAHFTDPYDHLAKLKSQLLGEMAEYVVKIDTRDIPSDKAQYMVLKALLDYVEPKKDMFKILLYKSGDHELQKEILSMLGEKIFKPDLEKARAEEEVADVLIYASNGCFGLFYQWLVSDDVSNEKIARLMTELTRKLF